MSRPFPTLKHVYQSFLLDSTRWNHVAARDDDVVVATPYKSGTTWMQNIVLHLIFRDLQPRAIDAFSPWVDSRARPLADMVARLEGQDHRRCLKSHLPLDGMPYRANARYIVVGRDPRDVFMSMWNHYSAYTPAMYALFNDTPGRVGPPLPPCPEDIREFWRLWTTQGWFDWETEGWPHWSNFRHVQTWWDYRHLPNILFVHYNDLLADLSGEIVRIAGYLDIDLSPELLGGIVRMTCFRSMKRDAELLEPTAHERFEGGAQRFINKGTNGRWREVLSAEDLTLYEAAAARELSPDCRAWLENGRLHAI